MTKAELFQSLLRWCVCPAVFNYNPPSERRDGALYQ